MNRQAGTNRWKSILKTALVTCVLSLGWIGTIVAQESTVDLQALTRETQNMSQRADEVTLVWWIPGEYWQASLAQNPALTGPQIEQFINMLRPYIVIVALDGKMGAFGGVTYTPAAEMRSSIQVIDHQGNSYMPIAEDSVDADVKNFLSMMKPVLVNMLGPMGANMHFFLFPAKGTAGGSIAEAKKEGAFSVKLGEREFRWRLPLGSLLPPKVCPTCGEKLNGAYRFCPWDGSKL